MKFELNTACSLIVFLSGMVVMFATTHRVSFVAFAIVAGLTVLTAILLLAEAYHSSKNAAEIRKLLIDWDSKRTEPTT